MDCIIINRVSDRKQKEGYSLDAQVKHGTEYAKEKGFDVIKTLTFQETASKQAHRKKFGEILSFIESYPEKKTLAIVVEKSDRLGRNHGDKEIIQKLYREGRIEVHFYKEAKVFDKRSTATDIFIDDIMTSVGKYAALNIARESIKGMQEKCEQGWFPVRAPIGYLNAKDQNKISRHKIIVSDPRTRHLVLRLFELRAELKSYETIRITMLESGLVPADLRNRFTRQSSIEKILKNPFYGGKFEWRGQWYTGQHELIIPNGLFNKVQETFKQSCSRLHQKRGLFTRWIKCECGCQVTYDPKIKKLKSTGQTKMYPYYRCSNGKKAHEKYSYLSEDDMLNQLGRSVDKISITDDLAREVAEALNKAHIKVKNARKREIEDYRTALKALENKEDECYNDFKSGILDEQGYQRQIKFARDERARFTDLMEKAQETIDDAYLVTAKKILELATNAKALWLSRSKEERLDFLDKILSNRVFDYPTVRYEIKKPFQILSEMASSSNVRPQGDLNPQIKSIRPHYQKGKEKEVTDRSQI